MSQVVEREVDTCRQHAPRIARSTTCESITHPQAFERRLQIGNRGKLIQGVLCAVRPGRPAGQSANPGYVPESKLVRSRPMYSTTKSRSFRCCSSHEWRPASPTARPAGLCSSAAMPAETGLRTAAPSNAMRRFAGHFFQHCFRLRHGIIRSSAARLDRAWRFVSAARTTKPSPPRAAGPTKLRR